MDAIFTSLLLLTLIHLLLYSSSALESLLPGSPLSVERSLDLLYSPDRTFTCGFYNISPNASTFSIWFSNSSEKTVVWSANPLHPVYTWESKFELKSDGGMLLKDYNGQVVWTNNVSSSNAEQVQAKLLNTGNLIVKSKGDTILWESFAFPTDTLLPTQNITARIKLISTNRLLAPGRFSFHFDDQYLLSLFYDEKDLSLIYWPDPTQNIWEKHRKPFNSTANGAVDSQGHFLGSDDANFTAADLGPRIMRRLTLDYDGNLRLYSLNDSSGTWSVTWMAFPQLCNVRGVCGINGICVYRPAPTCVCAPGYQFSDPSDWSKGCSPKFNITREQKVRLLRLPNTDFFGNDIRAYLHASLHDCKKICLNDSNCVGFAYWQGKGECYPKTALLSGVSLIGSSTGTMYIKLPQELKVSDHQVPRSQPFDQKYVKYCTTVDKYFVPDFLDKLKSGQNESKYWYFYGFLSAIFVVEVLFIIFGSLILQREDKQLREIAESWIADFIDTRLNTRFNNLQARVMMELAVSCLEEDRARRPTMESVVEMLVSVDEAG
ncbi:hypothetical protein OsI_23464 [Oryza sativa Indica Group]|uniref:non-specific serine/threonine protein kinase n=1 Tax=Oryza sativa subsp. indica TaxID=39946 RepID=A2YEC0_ORYSI|nr:hypothetical protein OsI_23464 [Oryza sativa Indica Group]